VKALPQLQLVAPSASPEEAAAIVAALERFLHDTAPAIEQRTEPAPSPWKRAALEEGISRQPDDVRSAR
jgi:hypothetical protein